MKKQKIKYFNIKHSLKLFLVFSAFSFLYADTDMQNYMYKRDIEGVNDTWHKIALPKAIFAKAAPDLRDLRIFAEKKNSDKVEIPYLLRISSPQTREHELKFHLLNTSHNRQGYYFTFAVPSDQKNNFTLNQISLLFDQKNFDWLVFLQGSHDQKQWFTILKNYRIFSFKNSLADMNFSRLSFPETNFRFFRLRVASKEEPRLLSASLSKTDIAKGDFETYAIQKMSMRKNTQMRQTEIKVELPLPLAVSRVKIHARDKFDYYRPLTIKYLQETFQTPQGLKESYAFLDESVLSSEKDNTFSFPDTVTSKLKIFIDNQNNQPLTIDSLQVQGYRYELAARFSKAEHYFLLYGKADAQKPQYDIERFADKIPSALTKVNLGKEVILKNTTNENLSKKQKPLFTNKVLLWLILAVIMLFLVFFSLRMIKKY